MPYVAKPKPCYMDQFEFYKVMEEKCIGGMVDYIHGMSCMEK